MATSRLQDLKSSQWGCVAKESWRRTKGSQDRDKDKTSAVRDKLNKRSQQQPDRQFGAGSGLRAAGCGLRNPCRSFEEEQEQWHWQCLAHGSRTTNSDVKK